jgi:hypothetical protein
MATITGMKRGLDVYYVEHNQLDYKCVELESGDFEVFMWIDGPKDFLGRCQGGDYKPFTIKSTIEESIEYIEKIDPKKV